MNGLKRARVPAAFIIFFTTVVGCYHLPRSYGSSAGVKADGYSGSATAQPGPARAEPVFGWPFVEAAKLQWRGGFTKGAPVTLAGTPAAEWNRLFEEGVEEFERDRRAILAMVGSFRISFQFLETMGFATDYEPARPYFSWATEQVQILEDRGDFISLQHTLVMFFKDESGKISGPMVMKHWRQDWTYEGDTVFDYSGNGKWKVRRLSEKERTGRWVQAVYQVDDSPRYSVVGKWEFGKQYASFQTDPTWRPLPRREHSVRDDYQVLDSQHLLTVTPGGWVHEQHNRKLALSDSGDSVSRAKEFGLNRYERIIAPSLTAANDYWKLTGEFWKSVREEWNGRLAVPGDFQMKSKVNDKQMFELLFGYASKIDGKAEYDVEAGRRFARETINQFVNRSQGEG